MRMNTTYALVDPRNLQVKYVGCSSNPRARLSHHCTNKSSTTVSKWIAELKQQDMRPEMVELESGLNYEKGRESEHFWIQYFKFLGAVLLNVRAGGDRGVHVPWVPSTWVDYYKSRDKGSRKYFELVANSQPF